MQMARDILRPAQRRQAIDKPKQLRLYPLVAHHEFHEQLRRPVEMRMRIDHGEKISRPTAPMRVSSCSGIVAHPIRLLARRRTITSPNNAQTAHKPSRQTPSNRRLLLRQKYPSALG